MTKARYARRNKFQIWLRIGVKISVRSFQTQNGMPSGPVVVRFKFAKTFPNNPLRNLRYFDFAPDNHIYSGGALRDDTAKNGCVADYHIYGCNVIQVRTKIMKIAARCVLFSQISSEMRLLIVSNCSLLLQLSLDFIFSTLFSPYWTGQLFYWRVII